MKNLKITDYINTTRVVLTGLGMATIIALTGCGDTTNNNSTSTQQTATSKEEKNIKEGILTIGDEIFLIKYLELDRYPSRDEIIITLVDGTKLYTDTSNFYEYEEDSETINKIKQLIIEEEHVIK